jgi:DAK2 domain fusion protein YloV
METLEWIDAAALRAVVHRYRDALGAHREAINRLNVYPVPDGDTGTNMTLTLVSVCEELAGAGEDMAATCTAIGHGSLMGARGNSGVILSQVLRGLADAFREREAVGPAELAEALERASAAAYGAVMKPVEGTILTVVRESAAAAAERARDGACLVEVLEAARARGADALARTPELLPVLAQAGVVDAGGAGFLLLLDALLDVVDARGLPERPTDARSSAGPPEVSAKAPWMAPPGAADGPADPRRRGRQAAAAVSEGAGGAGANQEHTANQQLRYEVMYLLEAPDEAIPAFKDVWAGIGDSIVVVGGDGIWNCHIHTDDIGAAIEAALDAGRPRRIRVTDLLEQVAETGGQLIEEPWVRDASPADDEALAIDEPATTAVVTVAVGDGIRRLFHSLHAQRIVTGGQTMNPSTADLLAAVEAAPAEQVVILPNNKNIVPVAEQVGSQTAKQVAVVPTRGVTEGFAALLAYDPEAELDANVAAMTAAAAGVVAGEVTSAVRDSSSEAGPIRAGDWLGLSRDGIEVVDADLATACCALLDRLVGPEHEIVTIIEGEDASPAVTRQVCAWLAEHRPDTEAEVHNGGQPLYPYLFGVE